VRHNQWEVFTVFVVRELWKSYCEFDNSLEPYHFMLRVLAVALGIVSPVLYAFAANGWKPLW
jgi:hypothetical protein